MLTVEDAFLCRCRGERILKSRNHGFILASACAVIALATTGAAVAAQVGVRLGANSATAVTSAQANPRLIHSSAIGAPIQALRSLGANVRLPSQLRFGRNAGPAYRPVAGNNAEALGPFRGKSLRKLSSAPDPYAGIPSLPTFPIRRPNFRVPSPPTNVIQAIDSASYNEADFPIRERASHNVVTGPNSIFGSGSSTDIDGTTDGNYIVTSANRTTAASNDFTVYNYQNGSIRANSSELNFFCNSSNLPVCRTGATPGDGRVAYDIGSARWILSVLFDNGNNTATVGLAVSVTSDPGGYYYLYQYAACDATENNIDQPHLGFNDRWIVINSNCPVRGQPGLAVFDKNNLYNGGGLSQNRNFFKFLDPQDVSTSYRDDPSRTYTTTAGDREYLTESVINNGYAATQYSYFDCNTDNPVFHSNMATVRSNFQARLLSLYTPVSEPNGCNYCLNYESYSVIHSSTVNSIYPNGYPAIYATAAFQDTDPRYTNRTQVVSTALVETTNNSRAIQLLGRGSGDGSMASEIALPYDGNGVNLAILGYAHSDSSFYPGTLFAEWNSDANTFNFANIVFATGNHDPNRQGDGARWIDFLDGASPVPYSSQVLLSGSFSSGSTNDSDRSNKFGSVGL